MPETKRYIALAVVVLLIVATIVYIETHGNKSSVPPPPENIPDSELQYTSAADFKGATGWLNTPQPIDLVALRGKVVLVDFWTYSCINCIRTFPYLNGWHDAYKDHGFVIVGVHSPEFRFERDPENVKDAAQRYHLEYPIALDNDYGIWNAYHNHYWPAKYLVDQYGKIRYTHFGEGDYEITEGKIRTLLIEAGQSPGAGSGNKDVADNGGATPELYAGPASSRNAIGNPEGHAPNRTITYQRPSQLTPDKIYLVGTWFNDDDFVRATQSGSVLVDFHGGGGNFVADGKGCAEVLLDGKPLPSDHAGRDVTYANGRACVTLDGARSYDFYAGANERHTVELKVPAQFELFTFDFSSTATGST